MGGQVLRRPLVLRVLCVLCGAHERAAHPQRAAGEAGAAGPPLRGGGGGGGDEGGRVEGGRRSGRLRGMRGRGERPLGGGGGHKKTVVQDNVRKIIKNWQKLVWKLGKFEFLKKVVP